MQVKSIGQTKHLLLEHQHGLDAYCQKCQRWATVNLSEIVASGQGQQTFIGRNPRCQVCGSSCHWPIVQQKKSRVDTRQCYPSPVSVGRHRGQRRNWGFRGDSE